MVAWSEYMVEAKDPKLVNVKAVRCEKCDRLMEHYNTFIMPNSHTNGFRAAIDVKLEPGQSTDLRAFLRAGNKALTETWTYPWAAE